MNETLLRWMTTSPSSGVGGPWGLMSATCRSTSHSPRACQTTQRNAVSGSDTVFTRQSPYRCGGRTSEASHAHMRGHSIGGARARVLFWSSFFGVLERAADGFSHAHALALR